MISLMGAYGLGFLFARLALVGLVFSLMNFLTGALVGLESLGWVYQLLRFALPLTWGISLMRVTLEQGLNLSSLIQRLELLGLSLHSLAYLVIGMGVFAIGYKRSRFKGTLAHY